MSIRVIAGSAKGRRLKMVPGATTRPIMDRVKEALFSIIGREIIDATFLDLYAGTGSVGIEALSRGAEQVVFVERAGRAVRTIKENLDITRLGDRAVIRKTDVFHFLKHPPDRPFDYIFLAPPQYKGLWLETLKALDANPEWVAHGTKVIVQIDPSEHEPVMFDHLEPHDERHYGKTMLWFLARRSQAVEAPPEDEADEQISE